MRANEFIYPFAGFGHLEDKNVNWELLAPRVASPIEIDDLVCSIEPPVHEFCGGTIEEQLLSIFLDPKIAFGDPELVRKESGFFLAKLRSRVEKREALRFVLMACPFKVPLALKTNRERADLAELLLFRRLSHIASLIRSVYAPGASITIMAEGILGRGVGLSGAATASYYESLLSLKAMVSCLPGVRIHNLDDIKKMAPDFEELWSREAAKLKSLAEKGGPALLREFELSYESMLRIVAPCVDEESTLMDVYNMNIADEALTPDAREARRILFAHTKEAVFWYRSLIRVRDMLGYMEKIAPGHLKLTFSPKPRNLGVHAINDATHILSHHGVPVHDLESGSFTVQYLVDVRRCGRTVRPVHLEGDPDPHPFYYEIGGRIGG